MIDQSDKIASLHIPIYTIVALLQNPKAVKPLQLKCWHNDVIRQGGSLYILDKKLVTVFVRELEEQLLESMLFPVWQISFLHSFIVKL